MGEGGETAKREGGRVGRREGGFRKMGVPVGGVAEGGAPTVTTVTVTDGWRRLTEGQQCHILSLLNLKGRAPGLREVLPPVTY